MQLELPRNRVLLLAVIAEDRAKRLLAPGPLKDGLLDIAEQLNQMIEAHDRNASQQAGV